MRTSFLSWTSLSFSKRLTILESNDCEYIYESRLYDSHLRIRFTNMTGIHRLKNSLVNFSYTQYSLSLMVSWGGSRH